MREIIDNFPELATMRDPAQSIPVRRAAALKIVKRRRKMSPEARKRVSQRMKQLWADRRKR